MLVDNTPEYLNYMQGLLNENGYEVVTFSDGIAALSAALSSQPDLILLDGMMPDMDGFDFCRKMRGDSVLSKIPILFISEIFELSHKKMAFDAGAVDYITKPFEEQDVLLRIKSHVKLHQVNQHLETIVSQGTLALIESKKKLEHEILARRNVEKELNASWKMLNSVFEGIADPLLLFRKKQDIMCLKLFNSNASTYYLERGIEIKLGLEFTFNSLNAPAPAKLESLVEKAFSTGKSMSFERTSKGNENIVEKLVFYPVKINHCSKQEVILRISDITEERTAWQEMAQADKLIALGTLVAGVAHEINNPNNVISLNAQILKDAWLASEPIINTYSENNDGFMLGKLSYNQLKEEIPALLDDVATSSDRITRIISVLRNYSVKDATISQFAPTNINHLIEETNLLLKHKIKKSTNDFQLHLNHSIPPVFADKYKLQQVLVNIISNALESLSEKSKGVFITTLFDEDRQVIIVEIHDEGIGIAENCLNNITNPFFTTKREKGGTGLGLSIVNKILSLHQAKMEVESNSETGTAIRLFFPAHQEDS